MHSIISCKPQLQSACLKKDEKSPPHTCMLTTWPSPFEPLTVAVTTTSWSRATKFLMHLSCFPECVFGMRSNRTAEVRGTRRVKRRKRSSRGDRSPMAEPRRILVSAVDKMEKERERGGRGRRITTKGACGEKGG